VNDLTAVKITFLFLTALAASWGGVAIFRGWSLRRNLLDVPNDRSSHTIPTPRGGGLVIVIVCLLGYTAIAVIFDTPFSWGYFFGALIVAGISWIDDLYSLPFWSRLIAHTLAAGVLIADTGHWHAVSVPIVSASIHLGSVLGILVTVLWIVWLLNAYNFMDGIDGIAALQAAIAGVAWSILAYAFGLNGVFLFAGVLACASVGFLIHNWQPAGIFMGDVGSAFLGFTLAAIPLIARLETPVEIQWLPLVAVLFVWFFLLDTVFTLLRRAFGRKRVWEAHRDHVYQKLVIEGREHASVTLFYGAMATFLSFSTILALVFSGIFTALAVFFLLIPTLLIVYVGFRKAVDLNN
jgi:UDP-N-acetylmuramyl pentapeptide phosphotransferase/UDP-N-acetylglucosamine-1-phosphate transferase